MNGQYKIFPKKLRIILVSQLILQLWFVVTILQLDGYVPLTFFAKATKIIVLVMAAYLSLNTVMNLFSRSKKERFFMTPVSAVAAACFWLSALQV